MFSYVSLEQRVRRIIRFVGSTESRAHQAYKAALIASQSSDKVLTGCFDGEWPYAVHRILRNATLASWEAAGCPPSARRPGEGDVVARVPTGAAINRYNETPPSSRMQGDVMACCLYSETGVGKITDIRPAGALVQELLADAPL
jgi:nitronate monooxygenase